MENVVYTGVIVFGAWFLVVKPGVKVLAEYVDRRRKNKHTYRCYLPGFRFDLDFSTMRLSKPISTIPVNGYKEEKELGDEVWEVRRASANEWEWRLDHNTFSKLYERLWNRHKRDVAADGSYVGTGQPTGWDLLINFDYFEEFVPWLKGGMKDSLPADRRATEKRATWRPFPEGIIPAVETAHQRYINGSLG